MSSHLIRERSRDVGPRPRGEGRGRGSQEWPIEGGRERDRGGRHAFDACHVHMSERTTTRHSFSLFLPPPPAPCRQAFRQVRCTLSHRFSSRPPSLFARSFPLIAKQTQSLRLIDIDLLKTMPDRQFLISFNSSAVILGILSLEYWKSSWRFHW